MKWIAVAIVVLALSVIGAAVVLANDDPPRACENATPFETRC
jgi:hypothetical protein